MKMYRKIRFPQRILAQSRPHQLASLYTSKLSGDPPHRCCQRNASSNAGSNSGVNNSEGARWLPTLAASTAASIAAFTSVSTVSTSSVFFDFHSNLGSAADSSIPSGSVELRASNPFFSPEPAHDSGSSSNGGLTLGRGSAFCEPNNQNQQRNFSTQGQSDNKQRSSKDIVDTPMDSNSFFDMAQQWALEKLPRKSTSTTNEEATHHISSRSNKSEQTKEGIQSSIFSDPEEFMREIGLARHGHDNLKGNREAPENKEPESKNNLNSEDSKAQSPDSHSRSSFDLSKLKDAMHSTFSKLQENVASSSSVTESSKNQIDNKLNQEEDVSNPKDGILKDFFSMVDSVASSVSNQSSILSSSGSNKNSSSPNIRDLIDQAHLIASQMSSPSTSSPSSPRPSPSSDPKSLSSLSLTSSSSSFLSQVLYFQQNAQKIQKAFESSYSSYLSTNVDQTKLFQSLSPTTLHYYLEHQDSIKNPSWKRRKHRFHSMIEMNKVEELNEALILSELSYADGVEEIREGLERLAGSKESSSSGNSSRIQTHLNNKPQWELLFCNTNSLPNQPSHFLAIQKNQSQYDDTLHVLMVVRGTKTMADLITDALMEAADFEYISNGESDGDDDGGVLKGKAHSGMVQSGKYLVERHEKLLSTLLQLSNKRKLEITLIGHSLGAGAATIAAMEWNSRGSRPDGGDKIPVSAHVIGFGCPALLSQSLSEMTRDYVTTVIADADVIPRMSGATLVNLLLDLQSFDYRSQAERDVKQALRELQGRLASGSMSGTKTSKTKLPFNISEQDIEKVMGYVQQGLDKVVTPSETKLPQKEQNKDVTLKESNVKEKVELFPPGTCIHFYRDGSGISGTYVPCTFFDEIDVARTMVDDHLISSGYRKIFLNLMRDFHKDDHFSFEQDVNLGRGRSR